MRTVAIIGNSGTNARPWTDAFLAAGWHVRKLVREPRALAPQSHVTATAFDFDDARSYAAALAGVDVLALITPAQPRQVEWEIGLIEAAQRAGVRGIIKLSVMGAEMTNPISLFARMAARVEEALRTSRAPHLILRANGFMQNLLRQRVSIEAGSYIEPFGGFASSRVDVLDLADVAVAVADGPFDGRILTLTGPAALTCEQMAGVLTTVLGRPVGHISPPLPQFRSALAERGLPPWQIDAFVELSQAVMDGRAPHLAVVTTDVAIATKKSPRSFEQFARREFGPRVES
jgi:uncharacterized protein YbjT (DUF2867 family)